MPYIDRDKLNEAMYHEAFEKDSDFQKWDGWCWIRYKLFENVLKSIPTADVQVAVQVQCKLGKWIPVTERLPEVDENVLVFIHYAGEPEFIEFFPPHDGITISHWTGIKNHNIPKFGGLGENSTVLAWMPLPEPYIK